jgi:hypothetical protein
VEAPIFACRLFGVPVIIDGEAERLTDLGVVKSDAAWQIVAVRTHRREATLTGWSRERLTGTAAAGEIEATWLREALFDRQIVDVEGRRVIRIGDVVLAGRDDRLEVIAVEVGAAAILRRLGFKRLAARLTPQLLPIDRLHLPSEAAGSLVLDAPREQLEHLDSATVASLLSRLPVKVAENAVRDSRHRGAVARLAEARRRRRRFPRTPA